MKSLHFLLEASFFLSQVGWSYKQCVYVAEKRTVKLGSLWSHVINFVKSQCGTGGPRIMWFHSLLDWVKKCNLPRVQIHTCILLQYLHGCCAEILTCPSQVYFRQFLWGCATHLFECNIHHYCSKMIWHLCRAQAADLPIISRCCFSLIWFSNHKSTGKFNRYNF